MVVFALLTIAAVFTAAVAGLRILKKEYLPLLRELSRGRPWEQDAGEPLWGEEDES